MLSSARRSTFGAVTRIALAFVVGAAGAVLAAATLGEYSLSAANVWLAAVIVPALLGTIMSAIGRRARLMWIATGPIAGATLGWGIGISSSWGIEPVPVDAWLALAAATVWPIVRGVVIVNRSGSSGEATGTTPGETAGNDPAPASANGQLSDARFVGRPEVGDP